MIEGLLSAGVRVAEHWGPGEESGLDDSEKPAVAGAVEQRVREFATGRRCARAALAQLTGDAAVALPVGASRAPRWPAGIVGSITHCAGYTAAAVVRATECAALGIDAEPDEPLPAEVSTLVHTRDELEAAAALTQQHSGLNADRLVFSCKEAVFKAQHPLTGAWLEFSDIRIELTDGAFVATFSASGSAQRLCGRWMRAGGLLLSVVQVPVSGR